MEILRGRSELTSKAQRLRRTAEVHANSRSAVPSSLIIVNRSRYGKLRLTCSWSCGHIVGIPDKQSIQSLTHRRSGSSLNQALEIVFPAWICVIPPDKIRTSGAPKKEAWVSCRRQSSWWQHRHQNDVWGSGAKSPCAPICTVKHFSGVITIPARCVLPQLA